VAGSIGLAIKSLKAPELWVTIAGWTTDNQRYRYDAQQDKFILENLSSQAQYPEFKDLIVEEVMVPSHDGVEVPLSLIYDKNIPGDGSNSVMMLGYGAYGNTISPGFNPTYLTLPSQGAILAIAHVRGGGELGDAWHKAGYKTTKPNTWKDFIACAEYLIGWSWDG
jgi:prolyl oligopeptidase